MITQEQLKKIRRYDPETGLFYRTVFTSRTGNIRPIQEIVVGSLSAKGYLHCTIYGKPYLVHRLVFLYMTGQFPPVQLQIDHINGVKTDNRWCNLRLATNAENCRNRGPQKSNTSGYKGVTRRKNRWIAQITHNQKVIHLGMFDTPTAAATRYNQAAIQLQGKFANTNP